MSHTSLVCGYLLLCIIGTVGDSLLGFATFDACDDRCCHHPGSSASCTSWRGAEAERPLPLGLRAGGLPLPCRGAASRSGGGGRLRVGVPRALGLGLRLSGRTRSSIHRSSIGNSSECQGNCWYSEFQVFPRAADRVVWSTTPWRITLRVMSVNHNPIAVRCVAHLAPSDWALDAVPSAHSQTYGMLGRMIRSCLEFGPPSPSTHTSGSSSQCRHVHLALCRLDALHHVQTMLPALDAAGRREMESGRSMLLCRCRSVSMASWPPSPAGGGVVRQHEAHRFPGLRSYYSCQDRPVPASR